MAAASRCAASVPRSSTAHRNSCERVTHGAGGGLAWPALLRKLDRLNPSYRS